MIDPEPLIPKRELTQEEIAEFRARWMEAITSGRRGVPIEVAPLRALIDDQLREYQRRIDSGEYHPFVFTGDD